MPASCASPATLRRRRPHDHSPQRRVADQEAGVDPDRPLEPVEPLAEARPRPVQAGLQGVRACLDLGHHAVR